MARGVLKESHLTRDGLWSNREESALGPWAGDIEERISTAVHRLVQQVRKSS